MKKLLIIAIMAVTAISVKAQYPSASLGYAFCFSEGMRPNRANFLVDWQCANVSFGVGGLIPSSKDQTFGVDVHIGPSFKVGKFARVNTEVVLGIDHGHFSPGGAIHARWLIIGPLGVFTRVQCTCPLEVDPVTAGQTLTTMSVGLFIQKKQRRYPVWDNTHH